MMNRNDIGHRYPCDCFTETLSHQIHSGGCDETTYYRNLIEEAYKYMTLNTYKQKVPQTTLNEFKTTMKQVSEIVRRNRHERNSEGN